MLQQTFDSYVTRILSKYQYPETAKRDVINAIQRYKNLRPKFDTYVFNDGTRQELACLDGTIPVMYKGIYHHIPLTIWLLDSFPYDFPICHIKHTSNMHKASSLLDRNGKVILPYLHNWTPASNLSGLIQAMITEFSDQPLFYDSSGYWNSPYTAEHINGLGNAPSFGHHTSLGSSQFVFNNALGSVFNSSQPSNLGSVTSQAPVFGSTQPQSGVKQKQSVFVSNPVFDGEVNDSASTDTIVRATLPMDGDVMDVRLENRHQCITCIKEYEKSLEELRYEYYSDKRRCSAKCESVFQRSNHTKPLFDHAGITSKFNCVEPAGTVVNFQPFAGYSAKVQESKCFETQHNNTSMNNNEKTFESQAPPPSPANLFGFGGLQGLGNLGCNLPGSISQFPDMQEQIKRELMCNPEMMKQLFDSPILKALFSNLDTLKDMIVNDRQMQHLIKEKNELKLEVECNECQMRCLEQKLFSAEERIESLGRQLIIQHEVDCANREDKSMKNEKKLILIKLILDADDLDSLTFLPKKSTDTKATSRVGVLDHKKDKVKTVKTLTLKTLKKANKYMLNHQEHDEYGNLNFYLYKGDIIPLSHGGLQVILDEKVERLHQIPHSQLNFSKEEKNNLANELEVLIEEKSNNLEEDCEDTIEVANTINKNLDIA